MAKRKRRNFKKRNRNKYIIRRIIVLMLLFSFFLGLKYIFSNKKDFILEENINTYINHVDDFSMDRLQLNWKEVAAIDGVKNVDYSNINKEKVREISKAFYNEEKSIRDFDEVLEVQGFTEKEKKKAKKNLEDLNSISLRYIREGKNKEKDKFLEEIKAVSIENYKRNGILPSITISQAILESNWGKSKLSAEYNNYFGIKANGGWKGKTISFSTKENYNDVITAKFRAYDSLEESVKDFGEFLKVNSRYRKNGFFDGKNYIEQAQALEDAGYSTKKNEEGEAIYADLLIMLIKDNDLMLIDNEAIKLHNK